MKAIGGYPELELRKGEHYHKDAIRLNTARNCLEYILYAKDYKRVYIPYYTCEAVLEPFRKLGTEYVFYHINECFEPAFLPVLEKEDAFLYTNYFGLKQDCVQRLAKHYGNKLIVDNAQAFFDMPIDGIDSYYSARKFFGVPDGAYLYTDKIIDEYLGTEIKQDVSFDRMSALLKRIDLSAELGYQDFQSIESSLCCQPIKKMSKLTEAILRSIDYDFVRKRRRENYIALYKNLYLKNKCCLSIQKDAVPLAYPFQTEFPALRQKLIERKIFCPTYWPNVKDWAVPGSIEIQYSEQIIPIPIDQRYDNLDIRRIIQIIEIGNEKN